MAFLKSICRRLALAGLLAILAPNLWAGTFVTFGPARYVRDKGKPGPVTQTFSILDPNTTYTLQIDSTGVSSAVIRLNGAYVFRESNFKHRVRLTKAVTLVARNELSVELRGKPGGSLTLQIIGVDDTPPTITASPDRAPNGAGWYNANVVVRFTCADTTSGIMTCPSPITVTDEAASQMITGTAIDNAGNTAQATVLIGLDKTPPTAQAAATPQPNTAAWNNTNVTVSFTGQDGLSGIASCTPDVTLANEGTNQSASGTCTDKAGNVSAAVSASGIKIDKTPPVLAITSPANGATLFTSPVTMTGTATDALSGVASVTCNSTPSAVPVQSPFSCGLTLNPGPNVLTAEASDVAGNRSAATLTVTYKPVFYVDGINGNDSNPGNSSAPWKTIQKAANTIGPGATVNVNASTYDERVQMSRSGTQRYPITFRAQGTVVMKGFTINASFIQIDGFEVANTTANGDDCDQAAFFSSGESNQVRNNYIHDVAAWGICLGGSSSFNSLIGNRIVHAGGVGIWAHGADHVIASNDISRTVQYHSGWTNIPSWIDADGIYIDGMRLTISGNFVHDILITDPENRDPHIDCLQVAQNAQAIDIVYEQNTCSIPQLGAPRCFQASNIEGLGGVQNFIIRNNVVHNMCRGFVVHGTAGSQVGVHIVNNTFYNLLDFGIDACNAPGIEVRNNIFHTLNQPYFSNVRVCGDYSSGQDLSSDVGNNLAYQTPGIPYPNDIWRLDPRFVDAAGGNFHLQSGSPAIDAGVNLSIVVNDFDSVLRPVGRAIDIGAFEYLPNANATVPVRKQ